MSERLGYFALVLHTHIPYVLAHGRWPHGMDWLFEATVESYIPLINTFKELAEKDIAPKVTFSITPITCEQLADPSFPNEFKAYLQNRIKLSHEAEKEFISRGEEDMARLANMWEKFYNQTFEKFENEFNGDLIGELRNLQEAGQIEIMTSAATHGYLPLLLLDESVQTQVRLGVLAYQHHFHRQPRGIWLPECAYRPRYEWKAPLIDYKYLRKGIDEFLSEEGLQYFIVDTHLLRGGKVTGVYLERFEALKALWERVEKVERPEEIHKHPYRAYLVNSSGEPKEPVAVFVRDPETGLQVWSGQVGYPGDGYYLEFHKKHFPSGLRFWRVTDPKADLGAKQTYIPEKAEERIEEHSRHFLTVLKKVLREFKEETGETGIIVAPYDTELFGHWWFEGPRFLKRVIERIAEDEEIEMITCGEYLGKYPAQMMVSLPEGSWGEGGFHWIWLNEWTEWTWRYIYQAEKEMKELTKQAMGKDDRVKRILSQMARELLLLQASDWQFLISTWSARDYGEMRVAEHYNTFQRLSQMLRTILNGEEPDPPAWQYLEYSEKRDRPFPYIDPFFWAKLSYPPLNNGGESL